MNNELDRKMTISGSGEYYVVSVKVKDIKAPWKEFCLKDERPRDYLIIEPIMAVDPLRFDDIPDPEVMGSYRHPMTYCSYNNLNYYYDKFVSFDDIDNEKIPNSINHIAINCFEEGSYRHIPFTTFAAMVNVFKGYTIDHRTAESIDYDLDDLTIILNTSTSFNDAPKKSFAAMVREIAAAYSTVFDYYSGLPKIFIAFSDDDVMLTYDNNDKVKKDKKKKKKKSKKGNK